MKWWHVMIGAVVVGTIVGVLAPTKRDEWTGCNALPTNLEVHGDCAAVHGSNGAGDATACSPGAHFNDQPTPKSFPPHLQQDGWLNVEGMKDRVMIVGAQR